MVCQNISPQEDEVRLPVDGCLDLHAFAPHDVPLVVREYLEECRRLGILEVRVIHGKGTGYQRERVRAVLAELPHVISVRSAPPEAGGWGATLVNLAPAGGESGSEVAPRRGNP